MFNHGTRHLSGQQRYVVDQKINDEKKRQAEYEKKKAEQPIELSNSVKDFEAFKEIRDEVGKFIKANPNVEAEIVIGKDLYEKIKEISPKNTYAKGKSVTIFGVPFVVDGDEENFNVRKKQGN